MRRIRLVSLVGVAALIGGLLPSAVSSPSPAEATDVPPRPAEAAVAATTTPDGRPLQLIEQARSQYRPVHHRPGQRSKYQDLQTYAAAIRAGKSHDEARAGKGTPHELLLASGVISNPMQGNMILVPSDQIAALVETDSGITPWWVDTTSSGSPESGLVGVASNSFITAKGGVAADLQGDGIQDLLLVASPQKNCLTIQFYTTISSTVFGRGFVPGLPGPCQSYDNAGKAAIAAGPFFQGQTGGDQIALAYASNDQLTIVLFDGTSLTQVSSISTKVSNNAGDVVALASGDFGGDGTYELAVAYGTSDGFETQIVTVSTTGQLAFAGSLSSKGTVRTIEMAAGDINGDGSDEIVQFVSEPSACLVGYLTVTPASSGSGFTLKAGDVSGVIAFPGQIPCTGGLGAFVAPLSTMDPPALQIAVASVIPTIFRIFVALFQVNASGKLEAIATDELSETTDSDMEVFLGTGTLNFGTSSSQGLLSQIVLAWKNGSTGYVGTIQATKSGKELSYIGKTSQPFHFAGSGEIRPVLGDFIGRSIRLGSPTYHLEQSILQIQAIIYEPPQHIDVFSVTDTQRLGLPAGPITFNVNYNSNPNDNTSNATWLQLVNSSTTVSQTTVSYGNSFQLSNEFSAKYSAAIGPTASFALKAYGGADFTRSQQSYAQTSWQVTDPVVQDTLFVYTSADYQVWEFPVLDGTSNSPTYVSIINPVPNDPLGTNCYLLKSCTVSGGQPQTQFAKDFPLWMPDHEPGNLLSWNWPQTVTPSNVGVSFFDSGYRQVDEGANWSMSFQTVNQQNTGTSWNVGVDLTVSGGAQYNLEGELEASVTDTFNGQYTHQGNTTQQQQFSNSTSVTFNYPASQQNAGYQARSYVYWQSATTTFPLLRVMWTVNIDPSLDSFWQLYASQPDFTFNLRTRDRYGQNVGTVSEVAFLNVQTPDLVVSPAMPVQNEPATITATIRNYSSLGYNGAPVTVFFYDGNPATGGLFIASSGFSSIAPYGTTQVSVQWTPTFSGVHTIYAVIVPPSGIAETHTDNNIGAAQVSVVPLDAAKAPQEDDPGLNHNGNHAFGPTAVHRIGTAKADLEIVPGSVRVSGTGANRVLRATVRANGGHFANVHVQFFDGDPRRNGRLIGAESLPLIWAGRTATASMRLPGQLPSDRTYYARILFFPRIDQVHQNNQAPAVAGGVLGERRYVPAAPVGTGALGSSLLPARTPTTTRRRAR
ncbi:MAG: hypothetical protein KatS3mg060_0253 [Dehalococcoidia bacterium]|nr:MAG: hypothetical protein KatS3mg060_0253 [Dehalococcoidia bacterium]